MDRNRTSSPYTTGGGGFDFERGVTACYLVALLRSTAARGQDRGMVKEVRLQRAFEGEPLDDLVIISDTVMGEAKLSLQVKHDLTFGSKDATFKRVISDSWDTFRREEFVQFRDRFGVVIGTYSRNVDKYYREVPNWARKSAKASDFLRRIETARLAHKQHRFFLSLIRKTLDSAAERSVSDTELWQFISSFVILHFDVHEKESRDRSHAVALLADSLPKNASDAAQQMFTQLLDISGALGRTAGSIDLTTLVHQVQRERPTGERSNSSNTVSPKTTPTP